jgi:hydrogenase-4 membrane subunit HyfE
MKYITLLLCSIFLSENLKSSILILIENKTSKRALSSITKTAVTFIDTNNSNTAHDTIKHQNLPTDTLNDLSDAILKLDSLFINGRNIHKKSIQFQDYKSLVIDVCFSYKNAATTATKFKYQLKGAEDVWHTTDINIIHLSNLHIGKFELIIKPKLVNENDATPFISVPINIKPRWFKSNRFIVGVSLLVLLILIIVYIRRNIKLKKKIKLRETQIKENEIRAKLEMDVVELQQKAAIAQMNPHFIFNSLNTINSIYANGDFEKANTFMNRFSRLLRMILIHSDKNHVPIDEEVQLLTLYFECNNLRSDHHFSYDINVDAKIDRGNTLIPTMLIQPFVENAIIHGISSLKEKGVVNVQFNFIDADTIECLIIDNGVGIRKASKTNTSHESKALDITKQRVLSINKSAGLQNAVIIEEMYSAVNINSGTKVHFIIPTKHNY